MKTLVIALLALVAAPARASERLPYAQCLRPDRVGEWYATGADGLVLRADRYYYRVTMANAQCPRFGVGASLHFRLNNTLDRACGDVNEAVVGDDGVPCPIAHIEVIDKEAFRAAEQAARDAKKTTEK